MTVAHAAPDPRHQLASTAAAAWSHYSLTCILASTSDQRTVALDAAVTADENLAEHDRTRARAKTEELKAA